MIVSSPLYAWIHVTFKKKKTKSIGAPKGEGLKAKNFLSSQAPFGASCLFKISHGRSSHRLEQRIEQKFRFRHAGVCNTCKRCHEW